MRDRHLWIGLALVTGTLACTPEPPDAPQPAYQLSERETQRNVTHIPDVVRHRLKTAAVEERPIPRILRAPGKVTLDMNRVAKAASRIDGQIDAVFVELGDVVRRGQPLVTITSLALDELVENYLVAAVRVDATRTAYRRSEMLIREQAISLRRLQHDHAMYREAQTIHQHLKEKLANIGITGDNLRELEQGSHSEGHRHILKAPMHGTVIDQWAVLGQGITAGTDLFHIADTTHVWVFANLPIEEAQHVQEGDEGLIVSKAREPMTGQLTYIAPIADEQTLTVQVRFDVNNATGQLKPNEYVEIRLAKPSSPALTIPLAALTMIDGTRGAFVQRGDGFSFVSIDIHQEHEGWVAVTRGVDIGDTVVVDGVFDLKSLVLRAAIDGDHEHGDHRP